MTDLIDEHLKMLDALERDDARGLTAWEADFCESVRERLEGGRALTEKQAARLEEIHAKKGKS